jgi:hypothetical protein
VVNDREWATDEWAAGRWKPHDSTHLADEAALPRRTVGATSPEVFLPPPARMADPWPAGGTPIARRGAGSVESLARSRAMRPPPPHVAPGMSVRARVLIALGVVFVLAAVLFGAGEY